MRAIGYAGPAGLRLLSRNDRDISLSYPAVAGLDLDSDLVVDGELVAWDERGRPDFARLQQRMHVTTPSPTLVAAVPVRYLVFDLLRQAGESLLEMYSANVGAGARSGATVSRSAGEMPGLSADPSRLRSSGTAGRNRSSAARKSRQGSVRPA